MGKYESLWDFIVERCKEIGVYEILPDSNDCIDFDEDYEIEEEEFCDFHQKIAKRITGTP